MKTVYGKLRRHDSMIRIIEVRFQIDVILLAANISIDSCKFLLPQRISIRMECAADILRVDGHEREEDRSNVVRLTLLFNSVEIGDDLFGADFFGSQTVRSCEYQKVVGMEI